MVLMLYSDGDHDEDSVDIDKHWCEGVKFCACVNGFLRACFCICVCMCVFVCVCVCVYQH